MTPLLELGLLAAGLYLAGWASLKVGLSPVVGYLALGLLCGPHGPLPVFQEGAVTDVMGELGLLMLLFFLGLEFSLGRFIEGGRSTVLAGGLDLLQLPLGIGLGMLLGLGWLASAFLGAAFYVSSSGVIARLIGERHLIVYPETERTLGVLVFEDLAMVLVLAGLGFLATGGGLERLGGVAIVLVLFALLMRYGAPVLRRILAREGEGLVLVALGLLVLVVVGATMLGFPEAVAAFLFGLAVEGAGASDRVEHSLQSWYDVAAATFFISFAFHVDLGSALHQLPQALLLLGATIVLQGGFGYLAGRLTGLSPRGSFGHGLMMLPRGEFSLVIIGLAVGIETIPGAVRENLEGMVSLYVVLSIVLGSLVFRRYDTLNDLLERLLRGPAALRRAAQRRAALDEVTLD